MTTNKSKKFSGPNYKPVLALWLLLLCGAATGCDTMVDARGIAVDAEKLRQIQPGVTSMSEVGSLLGSPSAKSTFGNPAWYYVSQQTESLAFYEMEVTDQKAVIIRFNNQGLVESVEQKTLADAREVNAVEETTPAAESQLTILQQLLGNVGRFGGKEGSR